MPVTSGWSWGEGGRGININVSTGITRIRNNWALTRSRISNDAFESSVGTLATSLSANNGGVQEVIDAPFVPCVTFTGGTVTVFPTFTISGCTGGSAVLNGTYSRCAADYGGNPEWNIGGVVNSTRYVPYVRYSVDRWHVGYDVSLVHFQKIISSTTMPWNVTGWTVGAYGNNPAPTFATSGASWVGADAKWIPTGYERGGYPVYVVFMQVSSPTAWLQNVIWLSRTGTTAGKWCAAAVPLDQVEDNDFLDECNSTNYTNGYAIATTSGSTPIHGIVFNSYGLFAGITPTAVLGNAQLYLTCESDDQIYDQPSVDWYLQRQRWIYIDSWVRKVS